MFIENAWYVAAWDREVGRQNMLRRTLLDIPVVLYRREDGAPVALEDRCCHRHAPLSKGKLRGDNVECPYHGLLYDPSGQCIPGSGPDGDPAGREGQGISHRGTLPLDLDLDGRPGGGRSRPDRGFPLESTIPAGAPGGEKLDLQGNYVLLVENLLDLSHLSYIHPTTLGTDAVAGDADEGGARGRAGPRDPLGVGQPAAAVLSEGGRVRPRPAHRPVADHRVHPAGLRPPRYRRRGRRHRGARRRPQPGFLNAEPQLRSRRRPRRRPIISGPRRTISASTSRG